MTTRGLLTIAGDWRARTIKEASAASGAGGESVALLRRLLAHLIAQDFVVEVLRPGWNAPGPQDDNPRFIGNRRRKRNAKRRDKTHAQIRRVGHPLEREEARLLLPRL